MIAKRVIVSLCVGLCVACSDDTEEIRDGTGGSGGGRPESTREGPEGCYILAEFRCDCAIAQADCTAETQMWTMGCRTCAQ